ncbi:MAG: choice-of-anchor V domain-containing protein [Luteibaculum sp.]
MRFVLRFLALCVVLGVGLSVWELSMNQAEARSSGSPGNRTGSPGDNGSTCRGCHSGSAPVTIAGAITTDIPATGYSPGEVYNIQASISEGGKGTFGFELTAEDENNSTIGQWILSGSGDSRLILGNSSATHTGSGNSGSGSRTWSLQWQAPQQNAGAITFYAALMAANGNGSSSGDNVYVSQTTVQPSGVNSIQPKKNNPKKDLNLKLYPNPASEFIDIEFGGPMNEEFGVYVIDAGGVVRAFYEQKRPISGKLNLNLGKIEAGNYFIRVFSENYTAVSPFIKL